MKKRAPEGTSLSHVTTASGIAASLKSKPSTPVLVHWQLAVFPLRIVRRLLAQGRDVLWVVSTPERARVAEQELAGAGIVVRTLRPPVPPVDEAELSKVQAYRAKKRRAAALRDSPYLPPEAGTVTIARFGELEHDRPLEAIASWASPVAVFDHLGVLNARWMEADIEEELVERSATVNVTNRDAGTHPIPVLYAKGVPLVLIARDELEVELHRQYFVERGCTVTVLATEFSKPPKLAVSVVGTNLVWSRFATGAFLSILACDADATVVGESLIGALSPDKLSMATVASLRKAVLKVSPLPEALVHLDERQTCLSAKEVRAVRARDFLRTAMLAVDASARCPELVVLCPPGTAAAVADFAGVQPVRLPHWKPCSKEAEPQNASFQQKVIRAARNYPAALGHASRLPRITAAFALEKKRLPTRFARLALSIHAATAKDKDWDLASRPEDVLGETDRVDELVCLFNTLLDAAFPLTLTGNRISKTGLQSRQTAIRRYRLLRGWLKN